MQPKHTKHEIVPPPHPVQHLCEACLNADECSLRSDNSAPVHQCEEFDGGAAVAPPPRLVSVPPHDHTDLSAAERRELGLCANCALQEECSLPRAQGGVWFCEEYR